MTDMPERIFVVMEADHIRDGRMWWREKTRPHEVAYVRADLVAAKDAEISRLRDDLAQAESDRAELVLAINSAVYLLYVPGDIAGIKARAHAPSGVSLRPQAGVVKE